MKKTELIAVIPVAAVSNYLQPGCTRLDNPEAFMVAVRRHVEFHPRYLMEEDERYVQLIPYVIYDDRGAFFLMRRSPHASEQRLASKYSLGIGGHIRQEDLHETDITAWALREFEEEVDVTAMPMIETVGLVYDPRDMVGRVHLGIVMKAIASAEAQIRIKDEHISGELKSLQEINTLYDALESWSQLVLELLASCK